MPVIAKYGKSGLLAWGAWRRISGLGVAFFLACAAAAGAAEPTPAEVLSHLESRFKLIKNAHSVSLWETIERGKVKDWTIATNDWDDLGRYRNVMQKVVFDEKLRRFLIIKSANVYNGEFEIDLDYNFDPNPNPGRRDNGGPRVKEYTGTQVHAIVWGKAKQFGNSPRWTFLDPVLVQNRVTLNQIQDLGKDNPNFEFLTRTGGGHAFVDLHFGGTGFPQKDRHVVFDPACGWVVAENEIFHVDGQVTTKSQFKYQPTEAGVWVPSEGVIETHIVETETIVPADGKPREVITPHQVVRFRVLEVALNTPDFSDDLFKVVLEPKTYVQDTRFKVNYRLGEERVVDAKLRELAIKATKGRGEDSKKKSKD